MRLRDQIEGKIRQNADAPDAAALAICVLLETEIGLAGNGWFDDDDGVLGALGLGGADDAT